MQKDYFEGAVRRIGEIKVIFDSVQIIDARLSQETPVRHLNPKKTKEKPKTIVK